VYASIRQGKAKAGMAEELTRRIKEGAIPIVSDVEGFMAYHARVCSGLLLTSRPQALCCRLGMSAERVA
jgi:hypothetical protein